MPIRLSYNVEYRARTGVLKEAEIYTEMHFSAKTSEGAMSDTYLPGES
jgi:hypothetical protein